MYVPSSLSSIPYFVEPFFLTPYSLNKLSGIARELKNEGYYSAFFHGAQNGSMGFQAFAAATGYDDYFGRENFDEDPRFGGEKEFDGTWAIWDEPFLQYYAAKMSEFKQPFVTSVLAYSEFIVIRHLYRRQRYRLQGPLSVPRVGPVMLWRCLANSFSAFFDEAKKTDWFENTVFVFTADHTNQLERDFSLTDLGAYSITLFIYDPSEKIKPERRECIAQQIDIMPTVLSAVGYNRNYVAFGKDLLSTPDSLTWAVNYNNGLYQYEKNGLMIQMTEDGALKSVYDFKNDSLLSHNLIDSRPLEADSMHRVLKALVQSYMQRMTEDNLIF